jgi:hypothetical protein
MLYQPRTPVNLPLFLLLVLVPGQQAVLDCLDIPWPLDLLDQQQRYHFRYFHGRLPQDRISLGPPPQLVFQHPPELPVQVLFLDLATLSLRVPLAVSQDRLPRLNLFVPRGLLALKLAVTLLASTIFRRIYSRYSSSSCCSNDTLRTLRRQQQQQQLAGLEQSGRPQPL